MAVKRQVRVGLIGAGLIGQTHSLMLRRIADSTEGAVRVGTIYDIVPERAAHLAVHWPGARVAASLAGLLDDPAIDAVWICTPTRFHREACTAAASAGKHIFCEKPLAMSAAEGAAMSAAITRAGVMSQVGLVLRFSPVYNVIRAMITAPDAGRLLAITMRDDQDFPIRGAHDSAWRNDPALTAGGTLIEHSVHDFDLLTWMAGPVARLYCRTRNLNGAPGVEDFAATQLEFAAGFDGQMTSVWHHVLRRPSNRRLEAFAENLFVACDHDILGPITVQRGEGDEVTIASGEVMRLFEEIILRERGCLAPLRKLLAAPYAIEDAVFVAALGGVCAPYPEFGAGVAAQNLVETAYESARTGRPVEMTP